ncbi:MAG: hypothetical protein ACRCT7_11135 [Shewanella sp.]
MNDIANGFIKKLILGRMFYVLNVAISLGISLTCAYILIESAHHSYWLAIERVQTVDFNLLSSSSTGTISASLKNNNIDKLNEVARSNNCLFGVVIKKCNDSDCKKNEIVADNSSDGYKCKSKYVNTNPSVTIPIYKDEDAMRSIYYANSYEDLYVKNDIVNAGGVIGFLELYRGREISFFDDLTKFYIRWYNNEANASRYQSYKVCTYFSLVSFAFVFSLLTALRFVWIVCITRKRIFDTYEKIKEGSF